MRRVLVVAAAVASLTSCADDPAGRATDPAPEASPATGPTGTVAAYDAVSADANGFLEAALRAEARRPDAAPETAAEVLELVDYEFAEGVALAEWSSNEHVCFTGPEGSYLTLSERGAHLTRMFGTGVCNYEDGDVVLEVVVSPDTYEVTERVVTGGDIARRMRTLGSFAEILNRSLSESFEDR